MRNPYSPPSTNVDITKTPKGSVVKALTIGLLADIGGSVIASIVLSAGYGFLYVSDLSTDGLSEEEITKAVSSMLENSWLTSAGMATGTLFSVLGGFLCARIARHSEYRLGNILAAISIAFGLFIGMETYSLLANISLAFVTWAAVMVGTHLGVSKNRTS